MEAQSDKVESHRGLHMTVERSKGYRKKTQILGKGNVLSRSPRKEKYKG